MIIHGDSLHALKDLPDNYVDSIVTDPPYGLKFMGKKWDYDVPSVALWTEVFRVLKPGGHVLSFGGTRTYHRMVVAIEDAGFEIRDQVMWIYGSGFPKSHDVSKGIDKAAGAEREVVGLKKHPTLKGNRKTEARGFHVESTPVDDIPITTPSTDSAKQWQGWGTALKPANEPICLARKPLEKGLTVAKNVQKWGCGALNIDESRISIDPNDKNLRPNGSQSKGNINAYGKGIGAVSWDNTMDVSKGRWPANILFDEEAAGMLDEQSGISKAKTGRIAKRGGKGFGMFDDQKSAQAIGAWPSDSGGGASRFFYVAKASKRERGDGNVHPTVKPIKLMEYLIKLITPPNGTVLDPFMGSGSTGVAAKRLGFGFIGIEREKEYCEIAEKRMEAAS